MKLARDKWDYVKIGDVTTELKAGFSSGKFELKEGEIAHFRPMNITDDCKISWEGTKYITKEIYENNDSLGLSKGDVLFNNTNSTELVGKSCYIDKDYNCGFSNHMTRIKVVPEILDSYYLSIIFFAYFKNRTFESYCQKWVGQSGINRSILSKIEIPLPPIEEQEQITSLFHAIETSIEQVDWQEENLLNLQNTLINGLLERNPHFGNVLNENNCFYAKFGQVADCIESHDKNLSEISRFVGLENIEPGNLNIATWGNISDGTTFTKRFKVGDILFGKRRSYLKKVAVADFNGICSGDILVFRARKESILPELLPHYVASEAFIQHAITTSAGSLSPRTKWKDLREFEFSIPDLKTQGIMLKVFDQIQILLKQFKEQKETLKTLKQNLLSEILN